MLIGTGSPDRYLIENEARTIVGEALSTLALDGKRVLILIPDGTRTMPMPLTTSIFLEHCRRINLGYLDPAAIDLNEWENREKDGVLVVRRAGKMLYRVRESNHEI